MSKLAERLKQARERKGLSAYALSRQAGLADGHVALIERDARKTPSGETLAKIATALDVSVEWLLGADEPRRCGEHDPDDAKGAA